MVKSEVGEDDVVFCSECNYAANIEKASSPAEKELKQEFKEINKVETPNTKTIDELVKFFGTNEKNSQRLSCLMQMAK